MRKSQTKTIAKMTPKSSSKAAPIATPMKMKEYLANKVIKVS